MSGKILKIVSNDLYGNVDDRKIVLFSCFEHTKYMNNYAIFAFEGEYDKKKLCYGSVHLKENSVVIFSIKKDETKYIDNFIEEYLNSNLNEFKIIDISKIEKVELVSYNDMEYNKLEELDKKSIIRKKTEEENNQEKKPIVLYIILILLILLSIGLTLLYFYPELFTIKYKELVCNDNQYDEKMKMTYDIEKDIKFGNEDKTLNIDVVKVYKFDTEEEYQDFKNNSKQNEYFNSGEGYKFIDDELKFKIIYKENSIIDDYDEMLTYLKKEGYSCIETKYEK